MPTSFSGVGELHEGSKRFGRVRYNFTEHEATQPAPRMGNPGAKETAKGDATGFVEPLEGLDLYPVFARRPAPELTLILEGGERWRLSLRGFDGEAVFWRLEPKA